MTNVNPKQNFTSGGRGFSLIELMIALVISSLLIIGIINVFSGNQAARRTQESLSEVQDNGRVAMSWIKRDLRMSGNTALTYARAPIQKTAVADLIPTVTDNCFTPTASGGTQAFDWGLAILPSPTGEPSPMVFGLDNVTTANTVFAGCNINGADLQAGSDIISVHYADATKIDDANLQKDTIYLNSGLGGAVVFQCNVDGIPCKTNLTDARADPSGTSNHRLISRLYYIRSWAENAGDGIPTLVRASMQNNGNVVLEPLVEGVTSLQVTYGLDTDNNGISDRYLTAADLPALTSVAGLTLWWTNIKVVRISMLFQSTAKDVSRSSTTQTFDVGGTDITLDGQNVGKVFSTTVAVRNPSTRTVE